MCVSDAFAQPKEIHSYAYNVTHNMLFFGLTGSVRIVALNSSIIYTINLAPNLPIHTIDTCNSHIVLSDLIQNKNENLNRNEDGHRYRDEEGNSLHNNKCCLEKYRCKQCRTADVVRQKDIQVKPRNCPPLKCTHNPNLPNSCLHTTITLITFDNVLASIRKHIPLSLHQPQTLQHETTVFSLYSYGQRRIITHLFLNDNSLFIATYSFGASNVNVFYGNRIFTYPLQNICLNAIKNINYEDCYRKNKYQDTLYCSAYNDTPPIPGSGIDPDGFNFDRYDNDVLTPLRICNNNETGNLCIAKVDQKELGNTGFPEYPSQWIHDVVLFTEIENNDTDTTLTPKIRKMGDSDFIITGLYRAMGLGLFLYICFKFLQR